MSDIDSEEKLGFGLRDLDSLLNDELDRMKNATQSENKITGLSSGFHSLDLITSGFQNSSLIVVGGRPSMGKTSLAISICRHAIFHQDQPIVYFTMDHSASRLTSMLVSSISKIAHSSMRAGKISKSDREKIAGTIEELKGRKFYIDDCHTYNVQDIRRKVLQIKRKNNDQLGLIIIDYIQLLDFGKSRSSTLNENSKLSLTESVKYLKRASKELNCPIMVLSQLNRNCDQRANKRPLLSDFRGSAALRGEADLALMLYRPSAYGYDVEELELGPEKKDLTELLVSENTTGAIGMVRLRNSSDYIGFEDWD